MKKTLDQQLAQLDKEIKQLQKEIKQLEQQSKPTKRLTTTPKPANINTEQINN
jgi:prefoldin subunit 5